MATTATVPSTPAAAPAASTASTSTATASTSAAAAPEVSTPAATPGAAPEVQTPAAPSGQTLSLEQQIAETIKSGFDGDQTIAETGNEGAGESTETPAAAATEPAKADSEQPSRDTTDDKAHEPEGQEEDDDEPAASTLGPRELSAKIAASPALKAALDADPELRDTLFANARLSAKAKPYTDMFGSPEEAKAVAEGHKAFANIRSLLGAVKKDDVAGTQAVINAMLEQDALRDDDGNPLRDANGRIQTAGNTGKFLRNAFSMRLSSLEQQAKESGDNETLAALDLVMERLGYRAPSSAGEDGMSEELKTQKAQIEQQQRELDEQRAASQREAQEQHENRVYSRIDEALDKGIASILDRATGLTSFTRNSVERDLRKAMKDFIRSNSSFQTELDQVERRPLGPKREGAHVALAQRYIQSHLRKLANPILAEAGITIEKAAAQRNDAQAARAENARSEVKGSTSPVRSNAQPSQEEMNRQVREQLTQKLGRAPTLEEMIAATLQPAFA